MSSSANSASSGSDGSGSGSDGSGSGSDGSGSDGSISASGGSGGSDGSGSVHVAFLECSVCLNLLCQPVTLVCGHSFCRACLCQSFAVTAPKSGRCPTCRSITNLNPETASENIVIRDVCLALNRPLYERRLGEASPQEAAQEFLPVFIYGDLLFPGAPLGLHLFERRYKTLARRAMESGGRRFLYHYSNASSRGASLSAGDVVLGAVIDDARFFHDGRCVLEARLTSRCRVMESNIEAEAGDLHSARVSPLADAALSAEEQAEAEGLVLEASELWLRQEALQPESQGAAEPPLLRDVQAYSLWLASVSGAPASQRRVWLCGTDTLQRLREALLYFRDSCAHRAQQRARRGLFAAIAAPIAALLLAVTVLWAALDWAYCSSLPHWTSAVAAGAAVLLLMLLRSDPSRSASGSVACAWAVGLAAWVTWRAADAGPNRQCSWGWGAAAMPAA